MEEQDYVELNTLLTKLRIICMKSMGELDTNLNADNMSVSRKIRAENALHIFLFYCIGKINSFLDISVFLTIFPIQQG